MAHSRSSVRKLALAPPPPPDSEDLVTVVEPLEWVRARDQIALLVRSSMTEALVPLMRTVNALLERTEVLARAAAVAPPRQPPALPPILPAAAARPPTPVLVAPPPGPAAAILPSDDVLHPAIDGNRRKKRIVLGATAFVASAFGALLYLFVLSYMPH